MTPNRLAAVPVRWVFAAVLAIWAVGPRAPAQPVQVAKPNSITGVYNGTYAGEQGPIKFKLTVTEQDRGLLAGTFTLYLADGADTKAYTCDIKGRYIPVTRQVMVTRGSWETQPPGGIDMLGMNGQFDPDGAKGAGQISGKVRGRSSPGFEAVRDADESAKLADAAKKDAGAPGQPVTPPTRGSPGANRPAPRVVVPPSAPAAAIDTSSPTAINGVYAGGYQAGGGNVFKARLALKSTADGSLTGFFTFDLPASAGPGSATYKLTGKYVSGNRWPFQFTTAEPVGEPAPEAFAFKTLSVCFAQGGLVQGKNGIEYSLNPDHITGPVSGGRGINFDATRDKAASADLDKAMAAMASGAVNPAPASPEARPAYEGVYTASYTSKQGPVKLKLTVWMTKENRAVSGVLASSDLAGVLTLDLPDGGATKTYTAEIAGMINPQRNLQLTVKRWEARPPTNIGGLQGKFDPDGGGRISGYISDATNSKFDAARDAAESAKLDVAARTGNVRPGVPGVFNGTYTRDNAPPAKFKLTITHNGDGPRGIAGMATLYLPSGTGEKAYTYSLVGTLDGYDNFHLGARDWETIPPGGVDLRGMGFSGKIILNLAENTARLVGEPASGSLASMYLAQFEATWDAKESAHVEAVIAAQRAVDAEEQAAALKAHEEMIAHAPPKELAPKGLFVRKSREYWRNFENDMLREVFDGGFGPGIDQDKQFQKFFCTYVEMFAAKCPEALPAGHQLVSIVWRTNRKFDQFGTLISEENHDFTVDMDPRFVEGYKRCWSSLTSKSEGLREALNAQQVGVGHAIHDMLAITTDVQRFFTDHPGTSASMRQLTENFVRAINDQPSLQQAGEKIDGAEAESDKDVLPGRYARLVDGANAYYRAQAKADPVRHGGRLSHDAALFQRLAELYQFDMSPEESYYYANDFADRFLPIMGPRASCPDPAWPRLHPDVERAIAEVK